MLPRDAEAAVDARVCHNRDEPDENDVETVTLGVVVEALRRGLAQSYQHEYLKCVGHNGQPESSHYKIHM